MIFIYFITILSESKNEITKLIGSQLFLHNSSILFQSKGTLEMPGSLITIPALTRYRIFSIRNLYVHKNLEHLITNSAFLQNFQLKVSSCSFSKFLKSPISMNFDTFHLQEDSGNDLIIHGRNISNCHPETNDCSFFLNNNRKLVIENCSFTNCTSSSNGGAIYIMNFTNVGINNCSFTNCFVFDDENGGAIYACNVNDSLNLTNIVFKGCNSKNIAGCIFINNTLKVKIEDCNFIECSSQNFGGAVYIQDSSRISFENCSFDNCSVTYEQFGGAIYIKDIKELIEFTDLNFQDCYSNGTGAVYIKNVQGIIINTCNFTNINIIENHFQGTLYIEEVTRLIQLNNIIFQNCCSNTQAGAVYIKDSNEIIIKACNFNDWSQTRTGAAVYVVSSTQVKIEACHFTKCPTYVESQGRALYIENMKGLINLIRVTFQNCNSTEAASAIFITNSQNIEIEFCDFSNCTSMYSGGAVSLKSSKEVKIQKCNFYNCSINTEMKKIRFGGGLYIEDISDLISLIYTNFISCSSIDIAGGGMCVKNSKSLYLGNILFNECHVDQNYASYGCGASLLNVANIELHKITTINCSATYGSGIDINMYQSAYDARQIRQITNLSGDYLFGDNCINKRGIYCFCATHFNNFRIINLTDMYNQPNIIRYLLYLNSCSGQINNFNFNIINDSYIGLFYFESIDFPSFSVTNMSLLLTCLNTSISIQPNFFIYKNGSSKYRFDITFNHYFMVKFNEIGSLGGLLDYVHFNDDSDDSEKANCYYIPPTNYFSKTEEFTLTLEFTKTESFTVSSAFSYSSYFTNSNGFTTTQGFTETGYFTYTSDFTSSILFTGSQDFTNSVDFTVSSAFTHTKYFTESDCFTPSSIFTPSLKFRSHISNPQMTPYNIGFSEKDGKGTKTDQGFIFTYICIALLALCLIISVIFAICKCRKPTFEESLSPEDRDEFYFPDFENQN